MRNYRFQETEEIKKRLIEIEAAKLVFDHAQIVPAVEEKIRRESLLKSSLYSAKIEGIVTTAGDRNVEVGNLLKAYRYVYVAKIPTKLSVNLIKSFKNG